MNLEQIYIVESSFIPTAASNNRLFAFADYLWRRGIKVSFIYLIPDDKNSKSELYNDRFHFIYLWENSLFCNKYLTTFSSIVKLRKILRPNIPVYIYSLLNCLPFIIKNSISVYHEYTENPEVVGVIHNPIGKLLLLLYKHALSRVKGLFVITEALKNYYIHSMNIDSNKVDVINMTVDVHRFDGLEDIPLTNTISYCGRISEYKDGVSILIRAFARIYDKHRNYRLRLIGCFEDLITEKNLKTLIKELEIESAVVFTGPVSASEMPLLLKSSKILALARPNNKQAKFGFATKIGEYLMTERPAVLTRVGAIEDYLTDKENCILANPDDVEDFADKLIWTIEHYDRASDIGKNGKIAALKYFNADIESEKIYNRIVSTL